MMRKKTGQSLSEYSICLAVVLIALVAMNVYVKRGLQGRYAQVVDGAAMAARQYEPYYEESVSNINAPRKISAEIKGERFRRDLLTDAGPISVNSSNIEKADVEGWQDL